MNFNKSKKTLRKKTETNYASELEICENLQQFEKKYYEGTIYLLNKIIKKYTGTNSINGYTAEDILSILKLKLLDKSLPAKKRRRWDKNKCPEFKEYVIWACLSIIRNEYKKYRRKQGISQLNDKDNEINDSVSDNVNEENSILEIDEFNENGDKNNIYSFEYYSEDGNLDEDYRVGKKIFQEYQLNNSSYNIENNNEQDESWIVKEMLGNLEKNNPIGKSVLEVMLYYDNRPRVIAKELNLTIKEVNNQKKRIKRLYEKTIGVSSNGRKNYKSGTFSN